MAEKEKKSRIFLPKDARRLDGRTFVSNGCHNLTKYYKCTTRECPATAWNWTEDLTLRPGKKSHRTGCLPDGKDDEIAMREWMRSQCQTVYKTPSDYYKEASVLFPEAAESLPFSKVQSFLQSNRRQIFPPKPTTLDEFSLQISKGSYDFLLTDNCHKIETVTVKDQNKNTHIIFYVPDLIETFFKKIWQMFVDGTFQTRTLIGDCVQMLTIIGIFMNRAFLMFLVLMSSRSEKAYTAVFKAVRDICPFDELQTAMMDFEQGMRHGAGNNFEHAQIVGCNVHFDRCLYRQLKPLSKEMEKNEKLAKVVRKILVLAWLPPGLIIKEYERQKEEMPTEIKNLLAGFLEYFERFWLSIIKPDGFSVWGLSKRTNNISESLNAKFKNIFGNRPVPCNFLQSLRHLFVQIRNGLQQTIKGKQVASIPTYQSAFKTVNLQRLWRDLHFKDITVEQFIESAIHLKGDVNELMNQTLTDEVLSTLSNEELITEGPMTISAIEDSDFDNEILISNEKLLIQKYKNRIQQKIEKEAQQQKNCAEENGSDVPHFYQRRSARKARLRHMSPDRVENSAAAKSITNSNAKATLYDQSPNVENEQHTMNKLSKKRPLSNERSENEATSKRRNVPAIYSDEDESFDNSPIVECEVIISSPPPSTPVQASLSSTEQSIPCAIEETLHDVYLGLNTHEQTFCVDKKVFNKIMKDDGYAFVFIMQRMHGLLEPSECIERAYRSSDGIHFGAVIMDRMIEYTNMGEIMEEYNDYFQRYYGKDAKDVTEDEPNIPLCYRNPVKSHGIRASNVDKDNGFLARSSSQSSFELDSDKGQKSTSADKTTPILNDNIVDDLLVEPNGVDNINIENVNDGEKTNSDNEVTNTVPDGIVDHCNASNSQSGTPQVETTENGNTAESVAHKKKRRNNKWRKRLKAQNQKSNSTMDKSKNAGASTSKD